MVPKKAKKRKRERDVLTLFLAVLLPPVAVWMEDGFGRRFYLNLVLTLLGFFPGMLHAVFLTLKIQLSSMRARESG